MTNGSEHGGEPGGPSRDNPRAVATAFPPFAMDTYFVTGVGGRVDQWSAAASELFGVQEAEARGHTIAGLKPPHADGEAAVDALRDLDSALSRLESLRGVAEELVVLRCGDGALRFGALATGTPAIDFRELLEAAPDAMVIVDAEGRVRFVNRQLERLFGYARTELLGQTVEVLVPPRLRDLHPRQRASYGEDPKPRPMGMGRELHAVRRDGTEFPAEISLAPMHSLGGLLVTAAIRDVTERRRLEQRMQEANRHKSEFLANMSHELRTPLNSIIGFAELLVRGKLGPTPPRHQECLSDILGSARHLLELINDVLDLVKVESGHLEFRPERVDPVSVVAEARDIVRGMAESKRIELAVLADQGLGTVEIDPRRFKQVLLNYLSNAIKFTPQEGRVCVRVTAESEQAFRVEVEDTGVGIATGDLEKLFVALQQLDAGTAKRHQGAGLGLALTKRIVEAQGGSVGVRSAPGCGSTFIAVLPRIHRQGAGEAERRP